MLKPCPMPLGPKVIGLRSRAQVSDIDDAGSTHGTRWSGADQNVRGSRWRVSWTARPSTVSRRSRCCCACLSQPLSQRCKFDKTQMEAIQHDQPFARRRFLESRRPEGAKARPLSSRANGSARSLRPGQLQT